MAKQGFAEEEWLGPPEAAHHRSKQEDEQAIALAKNVLEGFQQAASEEELARLVIDMAKECQWWRDLNRHKAMVEKARADGFAQRGLRIEELGEAVADMRRRNHVLFDKLLAVESIMALFLVDPVKAREVAIAWLERNWHPPRNNIDPDRIWVSEAIKGIESALQSQGITNQVVDGGCNQACLDGGRACNDIDCKRPRKQPVAGSG